MTQSVLLSGPITGITYGEATGWREYAKQLLGPIKVIDPLRGAEYLNTADKIELAYEDYPFSSSKAINSRSKFDVERCTLVLVNFLGTTERSIGTIIEIAWAEMLRKPIIIVVEKNNVHYHPMIIENASLVTDNLEDAIAMIHQYLA